jgi:serine/threonine protein kinase
MASSGGFQAPGADVWDDKGADPAPEPSVDRADPAFARAMARLGTTLHEKWHLDSLLGIGGTAVVYAATHRNGSRAAVKILNPELSSHTQVRDRFFREGYAANAVGHEGTVKVLDDDEAQDGSLFLVTELLEGEALEQRRMRMGGKLSESEVLHLSDQLLDVIAAAHAKGIVHRDLKPENVFLTNAGQLKVLDFGIAALHQLSSTRTGTITGAVMGTPAYMSPEQALGLWEDVDALSDIWAWGATMFHLLSGELVHDGRTVNEQLANAISGAPAPLAWVAPEVSAPVAYIVDRALERDKDKRWPDARSMQAAIRAAYVEQFQTPIPTLPGLAAPPARHASLPPESARKSTPTFRATAMPSEPSLPPPVPPEGHRRTVIAIGAAIALGLVGTCAHSMLSDRSGASATAPSATAPAASSPPAISVAAAAPPEAVPEPAAESASRLAKPAEVEAKAEPPPAPQPTPEKKATPPLSPSGRPPMGAPAPKANAGQSCNPPYVVDSETGKRRWKLECL